MEIQKSLFYEKYISSGQAGKGIDHARGLSLANYPQYQYWIKKHLPNDTTIRIIDLGCGHGALLYCLRELGYTNITGIDTSPEQVELAHQLGVSEVWLEDIDSFLAAATGTYDIIFLIDVLEHLTRSELVRFLERIRDLLKDSGKLIVHVPNAEGLFGMRIRYGDITHELSFTPNSIQQIFRTIGFNKIECFEDKPIVSGLRSRVRAILWGLLTLYPRLLLVAETGTTKFILSQNMLVTAQK